MSPVPRFDADLRCPKDGEPIKKAFIQGTIHSCKACKGSLFYSDHLTRVIRNNGMDLLKVNRNFERVVGCPGCALDMDVYIINGIEIDVCPKCECVWMDDGEFEKTKTYLDECHEKRRKEMDKASESDFGTKDLWTRNSSPYDWDRFDIFAAFLDILFSGLFRRF